MPPVRKIWPNCNFLPATNIPDMVQEMKRRNLFMYQIWGYVPGSGPGTWHQFKLSEETSNLFNKELGDKWLGMVTVLASPFGIGSQPHLDRPIEVVEDTPLPNPYPLLNHVREYCIYIIDKFEIYEILFIVTHVDCIQFLHK